MEGERETAAIGRRRALSPATPPRDGGASWSTAASCGVHLGGRARRTSPGGRFAFRRGRGMLIETHALHRTMRPMTTRRLGLAVAFLLALPALAFAQATTLAPPAIRWSGGQVVAPQATQIIGYDSGTSAPCIVGSTPTCSLASSGSGGGGTSGPVAVTPTTTGGAITTGGTAQNALAANASRKGWCITNNSALAEPLYVRSGAAASTTVGVPITAGGQACNQPGLIDQGIISVLAATTGHTFVSTEAQ